MARNISIPTALPSGSFQSLCSCTSAALTEELQLQLQLRFHWGKNWGKDKHLCHAGCCCCCSRQWSSMADDGAVLRISIRIRNRFTTRIASRCTTIIDELDGQSFRFPTGRATPSPAIPIPIPIPVPIPMLQLGLWLLVSAAAPPTTAPPFTPPAPDAPPILRRSSLQLRNYLFFNCWPSAGRNGIWHCCSHAGIAVQS